MLHTQIEDKERKTPIHFCGQQVKVKVLVIYAHNGALSDFVGFLVTCVNQFSSFEGIKIRSTKINL